MLDKLRRLISRRDRDDQFDDETTQRDPVLLALAIGVGVLVVGLVVVVVLLFHHTAHPISTANRPLADQIVQADTDLQTAYNAAQTSYENAVGAGDGTDASSAPSPSSSASSDTVTLTDQDPTVAELIVTMQQAQALHDTATLLMNARVTSLESKSSVVYVDPSYSTGFETFGQIPTSGFSLTTVKSLQVTAAQVTAWLPNLATTAAALNTQAQAVDQALVEAKANGDAGGYSSAVSNLSGALTTAQARLDLTQGQVADTSVWNDLQAAIAQAQTVMDDSGSLSIGSSTPDETAAAIAALNAATADLTDKSNQVMLSNQQWWAVHPGVIPPPPPPKSPTPTPTPSAKPTTPSTMPPVTPKPSATPTPTAPKPTPTAQPPTSTATTPKPTPTESAPPPPPSTSEPPAEPPTDTPTA